MRSLITLVMTVSAASTGAVKYDTGWDESAVSEIRAAVSGTLQAHVAPATTERPNRVLIIAGQDAKFDATLARVIPVLVEQKWTVGRTRDVKIQVLYANIDQDEISDLLGRVPADLPLIVKIEKGAVVREIKPGCGLPIDGWSLYWLYAGEKHPKDPGRQEPVTVTRSGNYPVRGAWWSHPGNIASHLQSGQHRGKFDAAWLSTLSGAELNSLHSDDHEVRVKWQYVNKLQDVSVTLPAASAETVKQPIGRWVRQGCPNGNCPTRRVWLPF